MYVGYSIRYFFVYFKVLRIFFVGFLILLRKQNLHFELMDS